MNLRRVANLFLAGAASQAIILVQQLLLPPLFIHRYGLGPYGQWLTLSAAVAYLNTLNFGLHSFVINELTSRRSRGQLEGYHVYQSTALRMILAIAAVAAIVVHGALFVPVDKMLHLGLGQRVTSLVLYFLGLQIVLNIPLNYFVNVYLVFGRSHRGLSFANATKLAIILVTAVGASLRLSFPALAILQLVVVVVLGGFVVMDVRRIAPDLFPTLRYWDGKMAAATLKPSAHFGLLFSTTFLVYQLPVVILARLLGPVSVVVFSVMRTLFSMVRQILSCFTSAIGPEIIQTFSKGEWGKLATIYSSSERVLFTLIPAANLAVLMASPLVLQLWLHKTGLFALGPYTLMAVISCAISVKEHKYQFHVSTNRHEEMARFFFATYLAMVIASYFLIPRFGMMAFLWCWLAVEVVQAVFVVHLNVRLFSGKIVVEMASIVHVILLIAAGTVVAAAVTWCTAEQPYWLQVSAMTITAGGLLGVAGWLFRVVDLVGVITRRLAVATPPT
jgi:O-antigen/teichoic acid export membrane protein